MPKDQSFDLIGRKNEMSQIRACLEAKRNTLLEGPVGVGKTFLALAATKSLGTPVYRVDGDSRYTEQKLSGWFDPPTVMKKGFGAEAFVPGPLVEAMKNGGVLFINELNRLPEGVQNVLLPAIDERMIVVPRLGEIRASENFLVIATQNPKEFVATSHLSEAILDRFELVVLDYQSEEDEIQIVSQRVKHKTLPGMAVRLARMTRNHPKIRRGASVRAAMSVAEIAQVFVKGGMDLKEAFLIAAIMALPTRIEIEREVESDKSIRAETEAIVRDLALSAYNGGDEADLKKKSR